MGARFLQDGLVVPGCYTAFSKYKQMVTILHREIDSVKLEKLSTCGWRSCDERRKQYEFPT